MDLLAQMATKFSSQLIQERFYAKEEIETILSEATETIRRNSDKSFLELTNLMIENALIEFKKLNNKGYSVPVPGMIVGLNVNDSNIKIITGNQDCYGKELTEDSLFDIASMTKLYTGVISYHLMEEGYYNLDTKVIDICPEFTNVDDLTIADLMKFYASYQTDGRIDDVQTVTDAKERLYTIAIKGKNYEYNDFHTMILKEVAEKITGKTYEQLLVQYIIKPQDLKNTYVTIPDNKKYWITGTANQKIYLPNDSKAVILGSGGHAGIFVSNDDIIQFSKNLLTNSVLLNSKYAKNLVVHSDCLDAKGNLVLHRGMYGSTYVNHSLGLDKTFLDKTFFSNAFAYQGSTRTQGVAFHYSVDNQNFSGAATILQNPASTDFELAKNFQEETNIRRLEEGKPPIQVVKEYSFINDSNQKVDAKLIDGRTFVSVGSLDRLNKAIASSLLKISFLSYVSTHYEPNYSETIDQKIRIR